MRCTTVKGCMHLGLCGVVCALCWKPTSAAQEATLSERKGCWQGERGGGGGGGKLNWTGSFEPQTLQQHRDSGGPRRGSEGRRKRIKAVRIGGTQIPLSDWDTAGHRVGTGPAWFLTIRRLYWWWWCAENSAANSCRARPTAPQSRERAWAAAAGIDASPHHTPTNTKPESLTDA